MHGVCLHKHYIESVLLLPLKVFWPRCPLSHTVMTCRREVKDLQSGESPPVWMSGLKRGQIEGGGDFGSSSGQRGMF